MAIPFSRTLRSFESDKFTLGRIGLLIVIAAFAGWAAWSVFARIPITVVSKSARIETATELYRVVSPLSGRVIASHMELGKEVRKGDVLFELDAEDRHLELAEEETRQASGIAEISSLLTSLKNEEEALQNDRRAGELAIEEQRARTQEFDEAARFAKSESEKMAALFKAGVLSEIEYLRLQSEFARKKALADATRLNADRLIWVERSKEHDRKARLENLRTEIVKIRGTITTSKAAGTRLTNDIKRHLIRSPISGQVGELAGLQTGSIIRSGDQLGAILPLSKLRAVGYFIPNVALGKIALNQAAQLRLDSFPWTQYGSVPMTVSGVSNEAREGQLRIEFTIDQKAVTRIPLQHGLTGSIQVEVERISPLALLLRTVGKRLQPA